jgi:YD repeat-containing protein
VVKAFTSAPGQREYQSGAYLTHLNDSGANLSGYGYDTFGRIKNHRWKDSSGTLLAGWSHDYDRVGNKLYQEALHDATESELYGYDGVYRLTSFERGQLNANKDDIASPTRSQTWTLDPLGKPPLLKLWRPSWDTDAQPGLRAKGANGLRSRAAGPR